MKAAAVAILLALAVWLSAAGPATSAAGPIHKDVIRADVAFQVIENFGASDCWRAQKIGGWSAANRERVADLLFSRDRGIGLSCWRFNIGGGINRIITMPWRTAETFETAEGQYEWTRQANERWFLRAAKERSVPQFLAFANSPPGRMTRNGLTFTDPGPHTTNLKPGYEHQFARYLADVLEHFRDNPDEGERIAFDYVSPVNEPQWDWEGHTQEGSRWANADVKAVVRALGNELSARRIGTAITIVESGNIPDMSAVNAAMMAKYGAKFGAYLDDFASDPAFAPLLGRRLGFHSYWSDRLDTQLLPHRAALARAMNQHPGWKLWQTEYCVMDGPEGKGGNGRDLTMTTALDVARVIHYDLTVAGVSAWQWWTALSEADYKDGLVYTDWKKPGDAETIYPSRLLWAIGNYSRFVRPGMRRIELAGEGHDVRGVLGSAYLDQAGATIVSVYLNTAQIAHYVEPSYEVGGRGWRLRSTTAYVTSDGPGDELRRQAMPKDVKSIRLTPRSVTTIVAEFAPVR